MQRCQPCCLPRSSAETAPLSPTQRQRRPAAPRAEPGSAQPRGGVRGAGPPSSAPPETFSLNRGQRGEPTQKGFPEVAGSSCRGLSCSARGAEMDSSGETHELNGRAEGAEPAVVERVRPAARGWGGRAGGLPWGCHRGAPCCR